MSANIVNVFDDVPVSRLLGMRLVERSDESALVVLDPKPELVQGYGVIQGGIVSALADAAGVCCFLTPPLEQQRITSIEFKINFLAAAFPDRGRMEARARTVQRGKKVGLADVEVTQGGKLIAKGLFTYMLA